MIERQDLLNVLDAILEGLQVLSHEWRYLHLNATAAKHGRAESRNLVGRSILECYPGFENTDVFAAMQRCMAERIRCTMENEFTFPDGSKGFFELRIEPVPQGICILSIDVTDRKLADMARHRAETQLAAARRFEAIGLLAAGTAHDFNNHLTLILNLANEAALRPDGPRVEDMHQIMAVSRASAAMTQELLSCGSRSILRSEEVDLVQVVRELEVTLRPSLQGRVELGSRMWGDSVPVMVDRSKIQRVITNLVLNARDSIPGRGTITISLGSEVITPAAAASRELPLAPGTFSVLAVTDSGIGMDAPTKAHLFEPFFSTKAQGFGTGLGLATAYGLIKQYDGHIAVRSEPGEGSTFTIYLPASPTPTPAPRVQPQSSRARKDVSTILVVDDSPEIGHLIARQLEAGPHRVLLAESGNQALELWHRHEPSVDLLLTDMMMPGIGGADLIELLRETRPDLKALCMSGYPSTRKTPPGVHFLEKPFTAAQLRQRVQELLSLQGTGCLPESL